MNDPYLDRGLILRAPMSITPIQAAWMYVGKAFQDGHRACEECNYCAHTAEPRPYGEGTVYEAQTECTLGQRAEPPELCPAYREHLQEQAEESDAVSCFHCDFCGKSQHELKIIVRGPKADICNECADFVVSQLPEVTDSQIDAIADSMPGGMDGFLKGWGWRQFARAVLEARSDAIAAAEIGAKP